ncbi:unnamed protein product [Phytomonas sp. EM1]|nr:unnamed protein product [Phytomonas sp. EM1]|eukprot:CCW64242.1 unnamed protein product [Phytomonas sp. isolate EM1]
MCRVGGRGNFFQSYITHPLFCFYPVWIIISLFLFPNARNSKIDCFAGRITVMLTRNDLLFSILFCICSFLFYIASMYATFLASVLRFSIDAKLYIYIFTQLYLNQNCVSACSSSMTLTNFAGLPEKFPGDFVEYFFNKWFDVLIYCEILYAMLIYYGPKWMENRKPMQLRPVLAGWNLFLTTFSTLGAISTTRTMAFLFRDRGFYKTMCVFDRHIVYEGEIAFWFFAFLISKFPEAIDTVLLILQKKPVIFLHWFHHLTVMIFCWNAAEAFAPSGLLFSTMNYIVHSGMYLYYFLCSIGLRKLVHPVAPLITGAQLLQMFIGIAIVLYNFYNTYISTSGCKTHRGSIRLGFAIYGTYCLLFMNLFMKLYIWNGGNNSKKGADKMDMPLKQEKSLKSLNGKKVL